MQQQVAVLVAEGVVDLFEAVQIDHQQRHRRVLGATRGDRLLNPQVQHGSIGQVGQQVVERLVLERTVEHLGVV